MTDPLFAPPSDAAQGSGSGQTLGYPQPWLDYASTVLPNSLTMVLRWSEFIWNSNGTYRTACQRTTRYFITDLMITEVDDEQVDEIRSILREDMRIIHQLADIGDNFLGYGNVFLHLSVPFTRYLQCRCGYFAPFRKLAEGEFFEWKNNKFQKGKKGCPQCGQRHNQEPWKILDKESKQVSDIRLRIMSPHEMEIDYDPYSGAKRYFWNIPAQIKTAVGKGTPIVLEHLPREILECVAEGNTRFEFEDDVIFHQSDSVLAGVYTGGWGLPRVISNFRLAFHYQVLNRFDQAIAMDYINGLRVISPEANNGGNGAGDPLIGVGGSQFSSNIKKMLDLHKKDPNTWHTSPIPLKYQLFGGEGQQLSPKDLMRSKLDEWLDATNIPAELFHGSLSVQSMPVALRIFENSWPEVTSLYNDVLQWVSDYMIRVLNYPEFKVRLQPVRMADDLERRQIMLQLMSGQQISPQTALAAFGVTDPREELRRTFEWQKMTAEEEKKFEDEMQKAQDAEQIKQEWAARSAGAPPGGPAGPGGAPPPGGAPMDPGAMGMGGAGQADLSTPEAMDGEAQRLAEEIIGLDATARRQRLIELKKMNETLWSLVKGKIQNMEQQAKTQGVAMLRQQGQMAPPG